MKDFWKNLAVKNYLVQDIFEVDEIVKRLGACPNDEDYKIVRSYYYWDWEGGEDWVAKPTTREDYEKYKDNEEFWYGTELNYDDFLDKFWFDTFEEALTQYVEPNEQLVFISYVNETFFNFHFDGQGKMFLRNLILGLSELSENLNRLIKNRDRENEQKINKIQEIVINQYSGSYLNTKNKIIKHYKFIYPEIENSFNPSGIIDNPKLTREEILIKLIGDNKNITKFGEFEKKLKSNKYLSKDSEWIKKPADLSRFYSYCLQKKIFYSHFLVDDNRGIDFLRQLFNFHEGKSIDTPQKRKKQLVQSKRTQFDFLDID